MNHFHILELNNVSIFQQLQIEEFLLRADDKNWCIINKGSSPAVVMGISGKEEELLDLKAVSLRQIPVIRRFSGGGTVVVDQETLFITWIANSEDVKVPCCSKKVMGWTGDLYKSAWEDIAFAVTENDYTINARKCGGNAQYFRKDRWLHHTSFLWDYDKEAMHLLKIPKKMPNYRQNRSHEEFICRLRDFVPHYEGLIDSFLKFIHGKFVIVPADQKQLDLLHTSPHRRATTLVNIAAD